MDDDWEYVDQADVPGDLTTLFLFRIGEVFEIRVDDKELMGTELHSSEDALADLACDRLADLESARVLVGGLGMGFTLAAALERVGGQGLITVAELMPAVVRWHHEYLGAVSNHALQDPRVEVAIGDVCDLIEARTQQWDAVLLDVDNGPQGFTRQGNGWLYSKEGIRACIDCLRPGGVLAVWSSAPSPAFTGRLRREGLAVEVERLDDERFPTDPRYTHTIWLARKGS